MPNANRILLAKSPDWDYVLPCGARVHFFDGRPVAVDRGKGITSLTGRLAPHIHPCPNCTCQLRGKSAGISAEELRELGVDILAK